MDKRHIAQEISTILTEIEKQIELLMSVGSNLEDKDLKRHIGALSAEFIMTKDADFSPILKKMIE